MGAKSRSLWKYEELCGDYALIEKYSSDSQEAFRQICERVGEIETSWCEKNPGFNWREDLYYKQRGRLYIFHNILKELWEVTEYEGVKEKEHRQYRRKGKQRTLIRIY